MAIAYPSGESVAPVQTAGDQTHPSLISLSPVTLPNSAARSVAVWYDDQADRIVARFYGADGQPLGGETILVESAGVGAVEAVAVDFTGFAVAWGVANAVYLQFFGPDGAPAGDARQIAFAIPGSISGSSITGFDISSHGGVVAAAVETYRWSHFSGTSSSDTRVSLHGPAGTSTQVSGGPNLIDAVMVSDSATGLFWEVGVDAAGTVTAASWTMHGANFAGTIAFGAGGQPCAAALPGGGLVVAWAQGGEVWFARTSDGTPIRANQNLEGSQYAPEVVALADGRFAIAWTDGPGDGTATLEARVFNADGSAATDEFALGEAVGNPGELTLTAGPFGGFTAAWVDYAGAPGDVGGAAVVSRSFEVFDTVATGHDGFDVMVGGAGADRLEGGLGDDWLDGRAGFDVMSGGAGADKFLFTLDGSTDRVTDFNSAEGDFLLVLDAQRQIADGSQAMLTFNTATRALSWDPDSDAGAQHPTVIGALFGPDVSLLSRASLAAGFQPSAIRVLRGDGSRDEMVFDWGSQAFDRTLTHFTHTALPETYETWFDDGSYSISWWDVGPVGQSWSRRVLDQDAEGRQTAYAVHYDDGTYEVFRFDTGGDHPWQRLVERYDALGRLEKQGIVWDDGTAGERYIDTYDTEVWDFYIDNYDAAGQLLNHTLYRDDGTVIG